MNRMAVASALAVTLLTLAAFVNHVQTKPLPGEDPTALPAFESSPPPAAAAAAGYELRPSMDVASTTALTPALLARLESELAEQVVKPLQLSVIDYRRFSRVLLPKRTISLRLEKNTIRAPKESGPEFVLFRLEDSRQRSSEEARRRVLAHGRVHLASGRIDMAAGALKPGPDAWEPAAKTLRRLGRRAK